MKKMIVTIIILILVFIGMIIYRNNKLENQVSVQDVTNIESYIHKIYGWKEVTGEALPKFNNINEANENWIWSMIKRNLEDYEIVYDQIGEKAKELFGDDFTKEFPKEGNNHFIYNEAKHDYNASQIELDAKNDLFLLDEITKKNNIYTVKIIEYIEDYSEEEKSEDGLALIHVEDINENKIKSITDAENADKGQLVVKENIDKFTSKVLTLKKSDDNVFYVEKVE